MDIELRDKRILDMNNSGKSIREIAKVLSIGKTTVSRVLSCALEKEDIPTKKVIEVKLEGTEERFESFVGWERTNVNEYANKSTGEIARVVYVKAKSEDKFGYFVKLGNQEKKFNPADNVIK